MSQNFLKRCALKSRAKATHWDLRVQRDSLLFGDVWYGLDIYTRVPAFDLTGFIPEAHLDMMRLSFFRWEREVEGQSARDIGKAVLTSAAAVQQRCRVRTVVGEG